MTASRPARAMRGGAVVLAVAVAARMPTIDREWAAALAAVDRGSRATAAGRLTHPMPAGLSPTAAGPVSPSSVAVAVDFSSPVAATIQTQRRPKRATGENPLRAGLTIGPLPAPLLPARAALAMPAPTTPPATASPHDAFALATAAYARLAAGDRRGAVRLFDAAVALDDPRGAPWRRQRDALTRHWSANVFSLVRASGSGGPAVTPVLGGGQSGGGVAYTLDPLADRPVALTVRGSLAHDDGGRTAFAAVGVQWRLLPGVSVAAERLIGIGPAARDEWTVRLAAGVDRRFGRLHLATYAEGGVIGSAGYAAGQARIGPEVRAGGVILVPGVGGWASLQRDHGRTVDRLDLGPGLAARAGPFAAALDYRVRAAGNATPGSGPVLTLSAAY